MFGDERPVAFGHTQGNGDLGDVPVARRFFPEGAADKGLQVVAVPGAQAALVGALCIEARNPELDDAGAVSLRLGIAGRIEVKLNYVFVPVVFFVRSRNALSVLNVGHVVKILLVSGCCEGKAVRVDFAVVGAGVDRDFGHVGPVAEVAVKLDRNIEGRVVILPRDLGRREGLGLRRSCYKQRQQC